MTNVADRILNLTLVPLTDPQWLELIRELELSGSMLSKEPIGDKGFHYTLSNIGVDIYADVNGWVMTIHFLVGPTHLRELPFGLKLGFRAREVHQRLGPPVSDDQLKKRESFSFDNYYVTVFYSFADETLEIIRIVGRIGGTRI